MKYVHTNIVSHDWKKLSAFYQKVFKCTPVPPERDLIGEWIDKATGIKNVHIHGEHLLFPGLGNDGPTLEIFQYDEPAATAAPLINRPGLAHLAFQVDDIQKVVDEITANGGSLYGEIGSRKVNESTTLTIVYTRDPDGNIVELLNWSK